MAEVRKLIPTGECIQGPKTSSKGQGGGPPCSSRRDSEGDTLLLSPPYTNTTTITDLLKIPMAESMLRYGAPSHREPTKQGVLSLLESDSGTLKGHSGKDGGRQLPESRKPQRLPFLGTGGQRIIQRGMKFRPGTPSAYIPVCVRFPFKC